MRSFDDIESELGLERFVSSPVGTLYFNPGAPPQDELLVRRVDPALGPDAARAYASLVEAVADFVEGRPELAGAIRVERPTEVGRDFVARPWYVYTSVRAYDADPEDDPPPRPPELDEARSAARGAIEEHGR